MIPMQRSAVEMPAVRPAPATPPSTSASPAPLLGSAAAPAVPEILAKLPKRNIPRASLTNRQDYATPVTNHVQAGESTGLRRFATVASELAAPQGVPPATSAAPSYVGRAVAAMKRLVGMPSDIDWMKSTIRVLRTEASVTGATGKEPAPTNALGALREANPIQAFWARPDIAVHARFGPHKETFLAQLDGLSQSQSPRLALALSFACLSAKNDRANGSAHLDENLLQTLNDPRLVERLITPNRGSPSAADETLKLARGVLEQCTNSNHFDRLVMALSPQGVQEHQLPALKRYLQADQIARNSPAPAAVQPEDVDLDALEAGRRPSEGASLAERVRDSARAQLESNGAVQPSPRQVMEEFFWNNNFKEDGPNTALNEVKQHFFDTVEQLGKAPNARGPLNSAYQYGLMGAERHLLADEANKVVAMVGSPALDGLVGQVQDKLIQALSAERDHQAGQPASLSDNSARAIALVVALQAWAPGNKSQLSIEDIVHGRAHEAPVQSVDHARIVFLLRQLASGAPLNPAEHRGGVHSPLFAHFGVDERQARVQAELKNVRLSFDGLMEMAKQLGVEPDEGARVLAGKIQGTINGDSVRPREKTPEAVGEMLAEFLGNVQFGNHIKLSDIAMGGFSTRGTGPNFSKNLQLEDFDAARTPIVARGDIRAERSVEHVIRAGAATHGGEMFLGKDVKWRASAGGGLLAGYTALGEKNTMGRLAGALDVTPYGHDRSNYEGAMFRVDRQVTSDVGDPHEPKFTQSDAQVRATMSEMAKFLLEGAPQARDTAAREHLLEELINRFGSQGLSMTLMKQASSAHRSDISLGGGASTTTDTPNGGRFGLSATAGLEKGWSTQVTEKDSTGSYRINNVRSGWFERKKASVDLTGNAYVKTVGLPSTTLGSAGASFGESGGSVRVRTPTREGNIVPEKTFSDTETADKSFFKEIVLNDVQKWTDLFAYQHRHLPPEEAQQKGKASVDAFFHKIENLRDENHVYYARERMHPDVAERIDELSSVASLVPPEMASFRAEVNAKRKEHASDDRSWGAASLIAFERAVQQDGLGGSLAGVRGAHISAVEGEREFIFDTIGWANLRQRERENPPTFLDT